MYVWLNKEYESLYKRGDKDIQYMYQSRLDILTYAWVWELELQVHLFLN